MSGLEGNIPPVPVPAEARRDIPVKQQPPGQPAPAPPAQPEQPAPAASSVQLRAAGLPGSPQPVRGVQFPVASGQQQGGIETPANPQRVEADAKRLVALLGQPSSEAMDQSILRVVREAKAAGRLNAVLDRLRETPHDDASKLRLLYSQFDAHSSLKAPPGFLSELWEDVLIKTGIKDRPPPVKQAEILDLLKEIFSDKTVGAANLRALLSDGKLLATMIVADVKPANLSPQARTVLLEILDAKDGYRYIPSIQGMHDDAIRTLRQGQ